MFIVKSTTRKIVFLLLLGLALLPIFYLEAEAQSSDVPNRPTNLLAHPSSPTRVDLFWNTPENDGGSSIIGYKIQYYKLPSTTFLDLVTNTGNTTTTYSHIGLTTDATYVYRVYSINSVGQSVNPSPEAIATPKSNSKPLENIPPNAPTSLSVKDMSPTSIELTWIKPATNNGPPVTGYKIQVKEESGTYSTLVENTQSTNTKYTDTNLTTNTKYTYKISAINSVGASSTSNESSATPLSTSSQPVENIAPNPPRNLKAVAGSPTKIILSWKEPSPNSGPDVTGYDIEFKTTGDYTMLSTVGLVTTYTHNGLNEGTLYTYRVYAKNSDGTSFPSNIASTKPGHTIVPTSLIADDISPTSVLLTWVAPSNTYGGSITGYTISEELAPGVYNTIKETNNQQTSYTVTGLKTGDEYTFVVKARYNIGTNSDFSDSATVTPTLDSKPPSKYTIPSPPQNLIALATSPIQIDLNWNYPKTDGGTPVTGYRIDVKVANGTYVTLEKNTESTTRTYSHLDRKTDTKYSYKVYAINLAGPSGPSNEASATPSETSTPPQPDKEPGPPQSLIANAFSPTQINLSWNPPADDGGSPITGYKIEVKKGNENYKTLSSNVGKNTKYSHTGVTTGTTYQYKVYSINSIGTSLSYAIISVTPQPDEPESTSNIPDFIDPAQGGQYYLDRYNNEPAYKDWFNTHFPDFTIEEAIELAIPGFFSANTSEKPILSFVDTSRDPQYYIDRYNNEPSYKDWFDSNFPDYTIYEAVGVHEPVLEIGTCGPGTVLIDGYCEAEKKSSGGCLIATAAYDSEISPQVQSLREFRDNTLLKTNSGKTFMSGFNAFYYSFSPTIADWERQNSIFKEGVKITISPLLTSLTLLNYVNIDNEWEVLSYGIGIILLNIGMYFGIPAFVVIKIKRFYLRKNFETCRFPSKS